MTFNWPSFLRQHNIPHVTRGPNTPRNHVSIKCVWCGSADPSEHLAINLDGRGYLCRRNREHRGRSPVRLVQALIGCSRQQAMDIVGIQSLEVPDDLESRIMSILEPVNQVTKRALEMPEEFRRIPPRYGQHYSSVSPYINYLVSRGFDLKDVFAYEINYCTNGFFKNRIIFPIFHDGRLVSWTGRTISKRNPLRYLSLPSDPEKAREWNVPCAIGPINNYLLWYDDLYYFEYDTIVLTEGPFDALKVNVLGNSHGICSTCFFTTSPSQRQIELLHGLLPKFRRRILMLDQDTLPTALRILSIFQDVNLELVRLPEGIKDPGELPTTNQLLEILCNNS